MAPSGYMLHMVVHPGIPLYRMSSSSIIRCAQLGVPSSGAVQYQRPH